MELCKKLDSFAAEFPTANLIKKANVLGRDVTTFLSKHPEAINEYEDIGSFVESLASNWINAPNPKVRSFTAS